MRILIIGKTGQVARELARMQWPQGYSLRQIGREECDLADSGAVCRVVRDCASDVVINAAAYTAVDRAESEPDLAARVNRDAPAAMAATCREIGAALIQLSTDYVFDGFKADAYTEDDSIGPLSVYGRTKAEGEDAVRAAVEAHVILRTSWVFAAHGDNFVRTVLRLAGERPELRIVADQRGGPTAAHEIATVVGQIVRSVEEGSVAWGTFHFTSGEPTTWYEFAQAIVDLSGRKTLVLPIATEEYQTAARRPLNSVLDCGRINQDYGVAQPCWRKALAKVILKLQYTAQSSTGGTA